MKIYYLNSIPTFVSNAEYKLIQTIRDKGYIILDNLGPHEEYLAERLYMNKILNKMYKESTIYYYLNDNTNDNNYDRKLLND